MNRVALITGAARGIGYGIARSLAKEGFDLVINAVAPRTSISAKLTALEQDGVEVLYCQVDIIAAATVIGLLAAAISTADSQIFALGSELRSLLSGDKQSVLVYTRIAILFFGLAAMVFSIFSSDELVLLARVSFAGTSLVGPLVLAGIFSRRPPGPEVVIAAAVGVLLFLASLLNLIPSMIGPLRLDLLLAIGAFTLASVRYRNYRLKTQD